MKWISKDFLTHRGHKRIVKLLYVLYVTWKLKSRWRSQLNPFQKRRNILLNLGTHGSKSLTLSENLLKGTLKCNTRFLDRLGLEKKIASQRKEMRKEIKDTPTKDTPSLEFMEEDSLDLAKIFESINPSDVPPQMQIMWEMKKTQLFAKSLRDHRWDPSYQTFYSVPCSL